MFSISASRKITRDQISESWRHTVIIERNNEASHWRITAVFARSYLHVVHQRGHSPEHVLSQACLAPGCLDRGKQYLSMEEFWAVAEAAVAIAGDDGIGIDIGMMLPPTAIGNVGYAMLCAATVGEVLEISERFWHLLSRGQQLHVIYGGERCIVEVEFLISNPILHHNEAEITVFGALRSLEVLLRRDLHDIEIWFDYPEPAHGARYKELVDNVHFGMPSCRLIFPASFLSLPLDMSNQQACEFALEQCKKEEALLGIFESSTISKVRDLVVLGVDGYPQLEEVAERLYISSRTLRRKLGEEGIGYSDLLKSARKRDAISMLDDYEMDITHIATVLGYRDPSNFTRAFKLWTNMTPSEYRQLRRHKPLI
ncbi:AraC family transcriptional regulator [Acinetobacter modestus]|uniref:helix-turn-helix transcriptional regulator n=1 Tax=Acinetobacter modestus TaxID=1776740 RepID=UPI002030A0EB|nr:AraC family transcriptional regulator [Acinetobacter modestus]MCM1959078.1 AraC family transcriptional regulator [Acinetobacter modestus]